MHVCICRLASQVTAKRTRTEELNRVIDGVDPSCLFETYTCCLLLQTWLQKVLKELPEDKHDEFKAKSAPACKWLAGMAKDLQ